MGKKKALLRNAPGWLDQMVGGWQLASVIRYRSGLPTTVECGGTSVITTELAPTLAP